MAQYVLVSETLSYHDALTVLGAAKSRVVTLLDAAATAGLTVWAATAWTAGKDTGVPITLFELKNEIVGYGHEVMRRVTEWRTGLSRFDRTQRLIAAHAILVVSSYFEALGKADLPIPVQRLAFTSTEQAALSVGGSVPEGYVGMIELLLQEPLPLPEPQCSYTDVCQRLSEFYVQLSKQLVTFISGLAVWDELDHGSRVRMSKAINSVPVTALELYDAAYRNLAADNREFAVWAGLTELHALGTALTGVTTLLSQMAVQRPSKRPAIHLMKSYHAAMDEPILSTGQTPDGVVLPSLSDAYLNPHYRVAEVGQGDTPASREWWDKKPTAPDIEVFLAGYLISPRAAMSPLVILGEPGSGKSKLTEVLAARLPEDDFLPVRVELRDVAAESMIQEQIEQAIYRGPGEAVSWHNLLEASGNTLPVVLLDGFDELIHAASINRYDYLEQARDFQRRQAQIGHPVVVIVTSRTVVADHVRFPVGSLALQLQPFTESQVRHWLEIWRLSNTSILAKRRLRPLPAEIALAHHELASQPLLLTMLAIFDATDNALQRATTHLGRAELYERLFTDFALRDVLKSAQNRSLPAGRQLELAERDLQQLGGVALSMFARGRQAATEAELNRDLSVLFPENVDHQIRAAEPLNPAQRATGRFFFIHRSEARERDSRVRTYEFLHSTFGEFFVARLTASALRDLAAVREVMRQGAITGTSQLDNGLLYSILSFSCLAGRAPIIEFLKEMLTRTHSDERARYREMLPELLAQSLYLHPSRSLHDYEPIHYPIPRRLAAYSANLVVLLVLVAGTVEASEIFGDTMVADRWREYGYLWRGSFTSAEWNGLLNAIRAKIHRTRGAIDVQLTAQDGSPVSPRDSIVVTSRLPWSEATHYDVIMPTTETESFDMQLSPSSLAARVFQDAAFTPSWHTSLLLLHTVPLIRASGGEPQWRNGIRALPGYWNPRFDSMRQSEVTVYQHCMTAMGSYPAQREPLLARLKKDAGKFSLDTVLELLGRANQLPPTKAYIAILNDLWQRSNGQPDKDEIAAFTQALFRYWLDTDPMVLDLDPELLSTLR